MEGIVVKRFISRSVIFAFLCFPLVLQAQSVYFLQPGAITDTIFTITASGTYIFTDDVYLSRVGATAISILTDDVTIDLDGRTLRATNPSGENIAIHIVRAPNSFAGFSRKNITIRNGNIANFNVHSVQVDSGSFNIVLDNLNILSSSVRGATALTPNGILLDGEPLSILRTTDVLINNCTVNNSRFGLRARASDNVKVRDSVFNNNGSRGISALDCSSWEITNCQASKQQVSDELGNFGLLQLGGSFWRVKNCDFSFNTATNPTPVLFPSIGGAQFQALLSPSFEILRESGSHVIENCTFFGNGSTISGYLGRGLALVLTNSCVVRNCISSGNFTVDTGMFGFFEAGFNNLYENCLAIGNYTNFFTFFGTHGFFGTSAIGACFVNCSAKYNLEPVGGFGSGFFLDISCSNCLVQNCQAIANSPEGFVNGSLTSVFTGNFAFGNPFNFVAFAPLGFITVVNGVQPPAGTFDERQIDNISVV